MKYLERLLEQIGIPPLVIVILILVLIILGWAYSHNWWGLRDRVRKLMGVPEVTISLDKSSYFYVPQDERNREDDKVAYYSVYLPIITIHSISTLAIHGIDVFIVDESLSETLSNCDEVWLECSKHRGGPTQLDRISSFLSELRGLSRQLCWWQTKVDGIRGLAVKTTVRSLAVVEPDIPGQRGFGLGD